MQVSVSIPFWLVNKSGIPLVFKREEDDQEAAGQFEEHERARSLTPLPFSFVSSEYLFTCQMRVGKYYHVMNESMSTTVWCRAFNFDKECDRRTLYVRSRVTSGGGGERIVEKSFEVGIIAQWGKGVFSRTKIVTFVPLFQIVNQTEHALTITQQPLNNKVPNNSNSSDSDDSSELKCDAGVSTNFHWSPRWDRLLRVRLHEDNFSDWSGSFRIDKETTFQVIVKSNRLENIVLQVSVTFENGSYRCVFMNADEFPPPYRIINFSEVPLFYCQTNTHSPSSNSSNSGNGVASSSSQMREFIRPKECKDYVMDEPLHPHSLTFSVFQEFSETFDLKKGGGRKSGGGFKKLYYQNAIFVAFTSTFQR